MVPRKVALDRFPNNNIILSPADITTTKSPRTCNNKWTKVKDKGKGQTTTTTTRNGPRSAAASESVRREASMTWEDRRRSGVDGKLESGMSAKLLKRLWRRREDRTGGGNRDSGPEQEGRRS